MRRVGRGANIGERRHIAVGNMCRGVHDGSMAEHGRSCAGMGAGGADAVEHISLYGLGILSVEMRGIRCWDIGFCAIAVRGL